MAAPVLQSVQTLGRQLESTGPPETATITGASMSEVYQLAQRLTSLSQRSSTGDIAIPGNGSGGVSNRQDLRAHFVGGLRRPMSIGSVTYTWPLIGLHVYPDHLEF